MTADAAGGVWQYSLDLGTELSALGAQVLVATMGPRPNEAQRQSLAAVDSITLRESDYKLEWMPDPWPDVDAAGAWLLNLAREFKPDVVHLNGYSHAVLPWRAPVVVVAHSCVYSWWHAVHGVMPPDENWSEYHRRVQAGLSAADLVVAPSLWMADSLTANYDFPAGHAKVIYNFSTAAFPAAFGKRPLYLAAGRAWDKGKNMRMLESIASRLPWQLRIAEALDHQLLLEEMHGAAIFVHPALYEPFGIAVLEAARAGCCLVLADVPSLRELWGGAAVFLDPHDGDVWAETLSSLSADAARRESFGQQARIHATQYTPAAAVEQYWNCYKSVLQSRKGAAA